jgi:hypothetical protein
MRCNRAGCREAIDQATEPPQSRPPPRIAPPLPRRSDGDGDQRALSGRMVGAYHRAWGGADDGNRDRARRDDYLIVGKGDNAGRPVSRIIHRWPDEIGKRLARAI